MRMAIGSLAAFAAFCLPVAGDDLRAKIEPSPSDSAQTFLVLTGRLSRDFFKPDAEGRGTLEVKPKSAGTPEAQQVRYAVNKGVLTARVPFRRSQSGVALQLTLVVFDKSDKPAQLHATLAATAGPAPAPAAPPSPPTRAPEKPGVVALAPAMTLLPNPALRAKRRFDFILQGGGPGTRGIVIRVWDPATNTEQFNHEVKIESARQRITFTAEITPNSLLIVKDQSNAPAYSQPAALYSVPELPRPALPPWLAIPLGGAVALLGPMLVKATAGKLAQRRLAPHPQAPLDGEPKPTSAEAVQHSAYLPEAGRTTPEDAPRDESDGRRHTEVREPEESISWAAVGSMTGLEDLLAEIVNQWLASQSNDRMLLLQMAFNAGIHGELWTHKDLSTVFQDLSTFVYPFEPSERDGGWLWMELPNSGEALAIPAAVAFFQVGKAPDLLHRLFAGFEGASAEFRFEKFYAPCRLRRAEGASNCYKLIARGALLLKGGASSVPAVPQTAAASPVAPADDIQQEVTALASRLQAVEDAQRSLAGGKPDTRLADKLELYTQLCAEQQRAQERIEECARSVSRLEKSVEELQSTRELPLNRSAGASPPQPVQMRELPNTPEPIADLLSPTSRAATEAVPVESMPEDWASALRQAAGDCDTQGAGAADHALRLIELQRALEQAGRAGEFRIRVVHLELDGEGFHIHPCELDAASGGLTCKECRSNQTWQMAVAVDSPESNSTNIVLPLGPILASAYLGGFRMLVEDLPDTQFRMAEVRQPARLWRPSASSNALYQVRRKLQWSGDV